MINEKAFCSFSMCVARYFDGNFNNVYERNFIKHLYTEFDLPGNRRYLINDIYGEKFDPLILFDSKQDISELLEEKTEVQSVREHLRKKQEQTSERKKTSKKYEKER